jgi:hypothetical protein
MLEYLFQYSVILSWALNICFLAKFAADWWRKEPSRRNALLALAAIAVPAAIAAFLLPPRGGYDNNHDFLCLGTTFFTGRPLVSPLFKEYSPLFTDGLVDLLSGYSLQALLWKNRLLPVLSLFVFFTGLRRLGAGLAASAGGAALLFLNFLSLLNASSFSTTSANVFIWLLSLLALFDAYARPRLSAHGLLWILASTVLVISSRFEFLPVNLLIFAAVFFAKPAAEQKAVFRTANLLVIVFGAALLAAWAARVLGGNPERMLRDLSSYGQHLYFHLGERNLAVIAGAGLPLPENTGPQAAVSVAGAAVVLCWLFLLAPLAGAALGCLADKKRTRRCLGFLAVLLAWLGYFSLIFSAADRYPLHFMRHQLYFFLPCAYLFALGLDGLESAARRLPGAGNKIFYALLAFLLACYAALNVRAALALNGALRTNDKELAFLMEAQRGWEPGCQVIHPKRDNTDTRGDLIAKYFPVMTGCAVGPGQCLLKYISPERAIFTDPETSPLAQQPLSAGPGSEAWRSVSFKHAFYTTRRKQDGAGFLSRHETTDPVPLTIGFFRLENSGRDKALLNSVAGACAFIARDRSSANLKFQEAAREDPSCLSCKYLLAVSEAALGRHQAAADLLKKIDKASPGALTSGDRQLVKNLARPGTLELLDQNPYFFLDQNLAATLPRRAGSPRE